jgi:predicted component of type VI protein secretion system
MYILIVEAPSERPRRFVFDTDVLSVGRGEDVDFSIEHVAVSRRQFEIGRDGRAFVLAANAAATNATEVRGVEVTTTPLESGDIISVGPLRMFFHVEDARRGVA